MNECCKNTMKKIIEEIIFNMKHAKFDNPQSYIDALQYALDMLNK